MQALTWRRLVGVCVVIQQAGATLGADDVLPWRRGRRRRAAAVWLWLLLVLPCLLGRPSSTMDAAVRRAQWVVGTDDEPLFSRGAQCDTSPASNERIVSGRASRWRGLLGLVSESW